MGKMRSPNYPAVGLREAVELANRIWKKEKRTPVSTEVGAQAIGYSSASGPARVKLSALKKYGLLVDTPQGHMVSDLAMKLIHSQKGSQDYAKALREAALSVELFRDLAGTHLDASEDALRSILIVEKGFSEEGANAAIEAFSETKEFAKLDSDGTIKDTPVAVGSYVQWNSQGLNQFSEPRRVTGVTEGGEWAFVEGSETGIAMAELSVQQAPLGNPTLGNPPTNPNFKPLASTAQDRVTLDEGPVVISWPEELGKDSVEDLAAWLDVLLTRLRRKAGMPQDPKKK